VSNAFCDRDSQARFWPPSSSNGLSGDDTGRLTARYGGRLLLAVGAAVVAAGFALYRRVETGCIDYWADILPATLLVAVGMGVSVAPLTTTVMASVDPGHVGVASGFNSAVARIAGLRCSGSSSRSKGRRTPSSRPSGSPCWSAPRPRRSPPAAPSS
jgi:hypothetical protein